MNVAIMIGRAGSKSFPGKNIKKIGGKRLCEYPLIAANKNKFIDEGSLFLREKIYAYEMDNKVSIDIDSMIDFQFASFLMNQNVQPKYI